jgi:hypothetical protein
MASKYLIYMVPEVGVEPTRRRASRDFESYLLTDQDVRTVNIRTPLGIKSSHLTSHYRLLTDRTVTVSVTVPPAESHARTKTLPLPHKRGMLVMLGQGKKPRVQVEVYGGALWEGPPWAAAPPARWGRYLPPALFIFQKGLG